MPWKTSAADYKTRVTIEQATESVNEMSEYTQTWAEYCARWANVAPFSGYEFQAAMATTPNLRSLVKLRSDTETRQITPKMRITISGRTLNISAVYDEVQGHRQVALHCIEEPAT